MMKYFFISVIFSLLGCTFGHERDNPNDPGAGDHYRGESNNDSSSSGGGGGGGGSNSSTLKAPAGVTAVGSSSKSITISWNAVTGANYYCIYRGDEASGPYTLVSSYGLSGTSYTNSNLAAYTTFYYKVAACDYWSEKVLGEQSAAVSATTFLVAPSGVNAKSETSSSIDINWNNLQNATAYRIFRSGSSGGTYTEVGTSTSNSYTDTGLPTYVQYYYKVSGYNSITEGDESSYVSATTLLKAPTGATAEGISTSSIKITWNAVTDANYYCVYRSDEASGPYTLVSSYGLSGISYTNSGLSPGSMFYYKVAACDYWSEKVLGEQSAAVSASTL